MVKNILTRTWTWLRKHSLWDVIAIAALALVLFNRGPAWLKGWQMQGTAAPQSSLRDLEGQVAAFPPVYGNWVVVFWATWCGPCGVELDRLKDAVLDGRLDGKRILAVSVGEDPSVVEPIAKERAYPFQVLLDTSGRLAQKFNVQATPTVVFLNAENKIEWITSGLSPSLVWRAERHLAK